MLVRTKNSFHLRWWNYLYIYKLNEQNEATNYIEDQILKDKHKGMISCLCQLNNGYILSGGADKIVGKTRIRDKNIIVWREKKKIILLNIPKL